MKVSEAIDQLKVGDTVWVKGVVDVVYQGLHPSINIREVGWFSENTEISLTEPQAEKVEVPDYVAEWYEHHKHKTLEAKFMHIENAADDRVVNWYEKCKGRHNNPRSNSQEILAMMDLFGYETEKEPRWVVKDSDGEFIYDLHLCGVDTTTFSSNTTEFDVLTFRDRDKAEAVATLVEGSVEEV